MTLKIQQVGVRNISISTMISPPGHCIALVQGDDRTLAANIGAAAKYKEEDLLTDSAKNILSSVKIVYVEGFFLSHSPGVVRALCDICKQNNVSLAFNLCGEYVCRNQGLFTKTLKITHYCQIFKFKIINFSHSIIVNIHIGILQKCPRNTSFLEIHFWQQK